MKLIITAADFKHGYACIKPQEFHTSCGVSWFAGFGDGVHILRRNIHCGSGVRGNRHIHLQLLPLTFPVADDASVDGIVMRLHPRHVANK